jgi:glycosyltransferase involved in cell wall biosynthesis
MRIGVDVRWIFREVSGIGTYTRELVRELLANDARHEYILFYADETVRDDLAAYAHLDQHANARFERVPFGLFSLRNQLAMPGILRRLGVDVFHSPNYMIPFLAFPRGGGGRTRCVVTLHDVIPLRFPEYTPHARKNRIPGLFRFLMMETRRRADRLIAVSECSRRDILHELRVTGEDCRRVVAIPNGVAAEFFAVRRPPRPQNGARLILYVGRCDPYKNLTGLVDIFAEVRKRYSGDVRLRIVGAPDPRYPEPQRHAQELGLMPWIEWSGHRNGRELAEAYAAADVFVLPSRYEGFGLTVLEAMACGTPVVCSNRASLPEVAGDAAVLRDPDDVPGFANAIAKVLTDERFAGELVSRGRARAANFTWARTAQTTLAVYQAAFEKRCSGAERT